MNSRQAIFRLSAFRHTQLPELCNFFGEEQGQLASFLRQFAGSTFKVPDHAALETLRRYERAAGMLGANPGADEIAVCMRTTRLRHAELCEVYQATAQKRLPVPPAADPVAEAGRLMRQHALSRDEACAIYGLDKKQRARVVMGERP